MDFCSAGHWKYAPPKKGVSAPPLEAVMLVVSAQPSHKPTMTARLSVAAGDLHGALFYAVCRAVCCSPLLLLSRAVVDDNSDARAVDVCYPFVYFSREHNNVLASLQTKIFLMCIFTLRSFWGVWRSATWWDNGQ